MVQASVGEHYSCEFYIDRINEASPIGQLIEHPVEVGRRQSNRCLLTLDHQGTSDSEFDGFERVWIQSCAECESVGHVFTLAFQP